MMRTESAAAKDCTVAIEPPLVCSHPDDVLAVQSLPDYRIQVTFHDGVSGIVDLSRLVRSPQAGVFAALADPQIFSKVGVHLGAVTWPAEIDLAPDAMYAALRKTGLWVLE